jgi:uncharacterized transporter YbjL
MRNLRLVLMALVLLLVAAVGVQADKWETSPFQAVAPATVTGAALSYQICVIGNTAYGVWGTGALGRDSHADPDAAWGLLAGADTNAPILPGISQLLASVSSGKARVGVYWSFQSKQPVAVVRVPFFSW